MTDLSFETQTPYTLPLGNAADFTFQVLIDFSFEDQTPANPPVNGILNFTFGAAPPEEELQTSSAQGLFVQYGQASSAILEDPIIDLVTTSASLLVVATGVVSYSVNTVVAHASTLNGTSVSSGYATSDYAIFQITQSAGGIASSRWIFESCASRIDVDYTTGRDVSYRYVGQFAPPKGVAQGTLAPNKGFVRLDDSYKNSRFKAEYRPYGNVYEKPIDPPIEISKTYLSSVLYPIVYRDTLSVSNGFDSGKVYTAVYSIAKEALSIGVSLDSGLIRTLLLSYTIPKESLDVSISLDSGLVRTLLLSYTIPKESLEVSVAFDSATVATKLITYSNYPQETLNVSVTLEGATLS
jgi:hypothetical protein